MDVAADSARSLVAAVRAGDRDAFVVLVDPHLADALRAAQAITGSRADAADAVQDALLAAWQGSESLRDPEAFGAWFRRIVVRAAIRMAKRRSRSPGMVPEDYPAGGDLERDREARTLARAFERLSEKDRAVLALHHGLGLPSTETARLLDLSPGTVRSRVHHALARLRAAFDAEERR